MPVFGLLGRGLSHSLSLQLHRLIYEQVGFTATYNLFDIPPEAVKDVIPAMITLGISGINITSPYKQAIMPYLDALSPEAEKIGAVNTVLIREDGSACGYNTDYFGFRACLGRCGIEIAGKSFLLCGMSGAGKAVYHSLADAGAREIVVASTDPAKGIPYSQLGELWPMDVIVNCTPLGMYPRTGVSVVAPEVIARFGAAVDLIYNPEETLFLQHAREQGLQTAGGLYMLIYQGMKSFEIWTGLTLDMGAADAVYEALSAGLYGR